MSDSNSINPDGSRTIRVAALARVEGEGALHLAMDGDQVREVRLEIYEPPRFFEAFLRGRTFQEVPDVTARICGICPVAYQMGSCHALEKALGVHPVDEPIQRLRNLLYCGEWIESHVLHMFMLHLPDFLGYESVVSMAEKHAPLVRRALRIKKVGNDIVSLLGGRSVHPVGVCVGGFYRAPEVRDARALAVEVRACLEEMCDVTMLLSQQIAFPDLDQDYEFVALCPDDEYPMNLGRIKSNKGLDVDQEQFLDAVEEVQVEHSTALHARLRERGNYMVGPLARLNLCAGRLHDRAAEVLARVCRQTGRRLPWQNNYLSLLARGIETVHALALAADVLETYERPERSRVPIEPRAGRGAHGTEAPRGICWHQYETNADGTIRTAKIIPPTSQNQATIEEDLRLLAGQLTGATDEEAALRCEHLIRNYDPCISCSVHFLKFTREHSTPSHAEGAMRRALAGGPRPPGSRTAWPSG
jgi:coenzyme F420-reducing hydrogenase alpha subunit